MWVLLICDLVLFNFVMILLCEYTLLLIYVFAAKFNAVNLHVKRETGLTG